MSWGSVSLTNKTQNKPAGSAAIALLSAVAMLWSASPATAQVVIGGGGGPAVVTDFDAIDNPFARPGFDGRPSGFVGPGGPLLLPDPNNPPRSRLLVRPQELGTTYPLPAGRGRAVDQASRPAPTGTGAGVGEGGRIVLRNPAERRQQAAPQPVTPQPTAPEPRVESPAPEPTAPEPTAPAGQQPERPTAPPPEPEIAAAPPPPPPQPEAEPAPAPETEPQPQPAPQPEAQPEPDTQVARLPADAALPRPGNPIRLTFESGSTQLSPTAEKSLGDLAAALRENPGINIQLNGFASAPDGSTSQARRTALLRTLAVRTFLIDAGVERLRMNVRALGNQTDIEPQDRVDIAALER